MKNLKLFEDKNETCFGGTLLKNSHAKCKRPWSPKAAMHVVLKSDERKLKTRTLSVETIIKKQAKKHFVRIYHMENVGNHVHLVIRTKTKVHLSNFLRAICGLIARERKVKWLQRPFSRLVKWGTAYRKLQDYMKVNSYEAKGYSRNQAYFMVEMDRVGWSPP